MVGDCFFHFSFGFLQILPRQKINFRSAPYPACLVRGLFKMRHDPTFKDLSGFLVCVQLPLNAVWESRPILCPWSHSFVT